MVGQLLDRQARSIASQPALVHGWLGHPAGPPAAALDRRLPISIMGGMMYDQTPATELSIMRLPEVTAVCGKSRAAIYKAIRKGEFPKQVKLSARASGWVRGEIEAWVKSRMAAR